MFDPALPGHSTRQRHPQRGSAHGSQLASGRIRKNRSARPVEGKVAVDNHPDTDPTGTNPVGGAVARGIQAADLIATSDGTISEVSWRPAKEIRVTGVEAGIRGRMSLGAYAISDNGGLQHLITSRSDGSLVERYWSVA
jgi:hypothetical protein